MKRLKLKSLSIEELIEVRDNVTDWISKKAKAAREELQAKLDQIEGLGGALRGPKKGRRSSLKGRKVPAKYRNPKKRSETWAGRGATPLWLREQLKKGKKLE